MGTKWIYECLKVFQTKERLIMKNMSTFLLIALGAFSAFAQSSCPQPSPTCPAQASYCQCSKCSCCCQSKCPKKGCKLDKNKCKKGKGDANKGCNEQYF